MSFLACPMSELTALGYADRRMNLQGSDEATMHRRFQERLDFPGTVYGVATMVGPS